MYLLLEADSNDDDTKLNHKELCNLIDGLSGDADDIYDNYLNVINSYRRFKSASLFLPPIDSGLMGPGVITEILVSIIKYSRYLRYSGHYITTSLSFYITKLLQDHDWKNISYSFKKHL